MKKTFDAIKMARDIRDKLYRQTRRMSPLQVIEFYRKQSADFRAELNKNKSYAGAH